MSSSISPWPVVKSGSNGHPIKTLSYLLRARGQSVAVDGVFGPDTATAVKAFQASHGLTADGIVGPVTWRLLSCRSRKEAKAMRCEGCKRSSSSATCLAIRARVSKSMGSSDRRQTRRCLCGKHCFGNQPLGRGCSSRPTILLQGRQAGRHHCERSRYLRSAQRVPRSRSLFDTD
jgi:hypothetical protein